MTTLYRAPRARDAFLRGWLFGAGYFFFGLLWVGNALLVDGNPYKWALPLAVLVLPSILSFFPAAGALCLRLGFAAAPPSAYLVAFAAVMGISEWLRGHLFTGFPWNLPGYAWASFPAISQLASIGGIYFLTTLTFLWGAVPACIFLLAPGKPKIAGGWAAFLAATLVIGGFWGQARLDRHPTEFRQDLRAKLVQPNIGQDEKWDEDNSAENLRRLISLSERQPDETPPGEIAGDTTLIVWPETALSDFLTRFSPVREALRTALQSYGTPAYLLTGELRYQKEPDGSDAYFNSLSVYNRNFVRMEVYDKSHLVPFGEYIPFQRYIPLRPVVEFSGFRAGPGPALLTIPGEDISFSALVCYEIIFSGKAVPPRGVATGEKPDFIVNVTNDAWYGISSGPYQHLQQARFRAIEEGRPVIRAANTGISAIIDSYGRILVQTSLFERTSVISNIPQKAETSTIFSRAGSKIFWATNLFFILIYLLFLRLQRRSEKPIEIKP